MFAPDPVNFPCSGFDLRPILYNWPGARIAQVARLFDRFVKALVYRTRSSVWTLLSHLKVPTARQRCQLSRSCHQYSRKQRARFWWPLLSAACEYVLLDYREAREAGSPYFSGCMASCYTKHIGICDSTRAIWLWSEYW